MTKHYDALFLCYLSQTKIQIHGSNQKDSERNGELPYSAKHLITSRLLKLKLDH